jgi:uncharacterized protein (DUF433 family)
MSRKGKGRRKVQQACGLIGSDPEIMGGTPVFLGTRVPVDLIADMTQQGAPAEEILKGYPSVTR